MSFKCPDETITSEKLKDDYTGSGAGTQILPSSILESDRDSTGLLKTSAVNTIVATLISTGIVPSSQGSLSYAAYTQKLQTFLTNSRLEYCFYEARYKSSLNYFFAAVRSASSANSLPAAKEVANRLATTQVLNKKINDLVMIMNALTEKMIASSGTLQAKIATVNADLKEKKEKLEDQNKIIQSNEATMRLQKSMVKYTEEKARYSDNLLKMYSFLNVVALGLLIYVYKAAGDSE